MKTEVRPIKNREVEATLLIWREASNASLSRFEPVATGWVQLAAQANEPPPPLPVPDGPRERRDVYTSDRVFLPGYVFVEMALDNDLWHVVKNTPRVTGFLQTGDQPNALSEAEVNAMLNRSDVTKEKPKLKLKFAKGEQVRITEGPFANFNGAVDDVNEDKQTLKVMVSIFGRPTPTEVSFANVEKAEQ